MLIDDYLPLYHFREFHLIKADCLGENAYQEMLQCDLTNSPVIKFLCRLRGLPKKLYTIGDITKMGFVKLAEKTGEEIIFGMITTSPMFNSCQSNYSQSDFITTSGNAILKAVINFRVINNEYSNYTISTETRVWCGIKMKLKFRVYWFFIKPFSQVIRKNILKQIRNCFEKDIIVG